jgi:hypothetical protein
MYAYRSGGIIRLIIGSFIKNLLLSFCANKMEKSTYVKEFESLAGNIVCHDKIRITVKFGRIIISSYMVTWVENQVNLDKIVLL